MFQPSYFSSKYNWMNSFQPYNEIFHRSKHFSKHHEILISDPETAVLRSQKLCSGRTFKFWVFNYPGQWFRGFPEGTRGEVVVCGGKLRKMVERYKQEYGDYIRWRDSCGYGQFWLEPRESRHRIWPTYSWFHLPTIFRKFPAAVGPYAFTWVWKLQLSSFQVSIFIENNSLSLLFSHVIPLSLWFNVLRRMVEKSKSGSSIRNDFSSFTYMGFQRSSFHLWKIEL
jgi:hypothetical protein